MYDLVSFVSRGRIRKKIFQELTKPMTPTEISKIINTHRPTVSRSILALEEKGLVVCITPNERMGRYYKITERGKTVLTLVNNNPSKKKTKEGNKK